MCSANSSQGLAPHTPEEGLIAFFFYALARLPTGQWCSAIKKSSPPDHSFQRASSTAFVFTLATAQVIVRGRASFRTDHVGNGGDSDLEFRAEASFG